MFFLQITNLISFNLCKLGNDIVEKITILHLRKRLCWLIES